MFSNHLEDILDPSERIKCITLEVVNFLWWKSLFVSSLSSQRRRCPSTTRCRTTKQTTKRTIQRREMTTNNHMHIQPIQRQNDHKVHKITPQSTTDATLKMTLGKFSWSAERNTLKHVWHQLLEAEFQELSNRRSRNILSYRLLTSCGGNDQPILKSAVSSPPVNPTSVISDHVTQSSSHHRNTIRCKLRIIQFQHNLLSSTHLFPL